MVSLRNDLAAIHAVRLAGDGGGLRPDEEPDDGGDLLRPNEPADRVHRFQGASRILGRPPRSLDDATNRCGGHIGVHPARAHRVHGDAFLRDFDGCRPRQSKHTVLRGAVGGGVWNPTLPATDATFTMRPCACSIIAGRTARMHRYEPVRLTAIDLSQRSRSSRTNGALSAKPALLIRMSRWPNRSTAAR